MMAGFDLGNSPGQILSQRPGFFTGKTAVQRTSSGVQGAMAAVGRAQEVLLAEDPMTCLQRDSYGFILRARREDGLVVVGKIEPA